MQSYRKGVEVAERYLGSKHPICVTLKNSLVAAKKAAAKGAAEGSGRGRAKEESKASSRTARSLSPEKGSPGK
jgi:hypothetical protein